MEFGVNELDLWGAGKSVDSEKSIAKHWGKRSSGETA